MENIQNFFAPVRTVHVHGGRRPPPAPARLDLAPGPNAPDGPETAQAAMEIEPSSDNEAHQANPAEAPQQAVNQNPPEPGPRPAGPGAPAGLNPSFGLHCFCLIYYFI
jgi:hypothetical protein